MNLHYSSIIIHFRKRWFSWLRHNQTLGRCCSPWWCGCQIQCRCSGSDLLWYQKNPYSGPGGCAQTLSRIPRKICWGSLSWSHLQSSRRLWCWCKFSLYSKMGTTHVLILETDSQNLRIRGSFWQKDTLVTHICTLWTMSILIFSPFANFGNQSLSVIQRGYIDSLVCTKKEPIWILQQGKWFPKSVRLK